MGNIEKLTEKFESVVDYNTKLDCFDGPLDLLLFLVKQSEIEIKDIFVSDVTAQYLEYIKSVNELDIEKASEYLSMAATLLEIKSKALLPRIEFDDDVEEEDQEKILLRRLEEYKLFKEEAEALKEREVVGRYFDDVLHDDAVNDPQRLG